MQVQIPVCMSAEDYDKSPVEFAPGRYQLEKQRLAKAFVCRLGFTKEQAKFVADKAAEDAHNALRHAQVTIKVGAAGKDGRTTISDASKIKGVVMTNPLMLVHVVEFIDGAGKHGISYGFTGWVLTQQLREYVDGLFAPEQEPANA